LTRYRLDTNVLIRFLKLDDPAQAKRVKRLFTQAANGECLLLLDRVVLIEAVWVLRSVYDDEREKIAEALAKLVIKPGIRCEDGPVTIDALYRYQMTTLDIVDCYLAAQAAAEGDALASFDKALGKAFDDVASWDRT
jgi:predicted nucleic acid-binding protein